MTSGVLEKTKQLAIKYYYKALDSISQFPNCYSKLLLEEVLNEIINRKK